MTPNRHRGEIVAELDGKQYRLRLTLGALAELETAYGAGDLAALMERLGGGRLSATDLIRIVGAGLRGGGQSMTDADVATLTCAGGATGFATIVAELMAATFGGAEPHAAS